MRKEKKGGTRGSIAEALSDIWGGALDPSTRKEKKSIDVSHKRPPLGANRTMGNKSSEGYRKKGVWQYGK